MITNISTLIGSNKSKIGEERIQKRILFCLIVGFLVLSLLLIRIRLSAFLPVISFRGIPFTLSFLQIILIGILLTFLLLVSVERVIDTRNLRITKSAVSVTSVLTIFLIYANTLSDYWNCLYFVPDSAGWLADPEVHTSIRPGFMRWFYELFLSKEQIAFNFYEDSTLLYNTLICDKEHLFQNVVQIQMLIYFLSLFYLTVALVRFLNWKHAILFALVVTAGYQGSGPYTNNISDTLSYILIGLILGHDLYTTYRKPLSLNFSRNLLKYSLSIVLITSFIFPLGYFSYLPAEINAVQSEALVFAFINAMIATAFLLPGREFHVIPIVNLGALFAGIALITRLATIGTVILFLSYFLILIWKKTKKVQFVLLTLILAFLPTLLINESNYKPEESMSFWGPTSYALYVTDIDQVETILNEDEQLFSTKAIELAKVEFEKAEVDPESIQPIWLSLGVYFYYGAVPAYRELLPQFSQDYEMNEFFKDFTMKVFASAPSDFATKYIQNLQISIGFYKPSILPPLSQSTSKIFYGPFTLLFFCMLIWFALTRIRKDESIVFLIASSVFFLGAIVASIFDGPSIRNIGINDIYLIPLILLSYSKAVHQFTANSGSNRVD